MAKRQPMAVALLSGGLDSTLAILLMLRQGIEVTAITFLTHFGCDIGDSSSCSSDSSGNALKYGFRVKHAHLAGEFISIVKNPKHGHGKNMNPCIDCRILMLREAKEMMKLTGADFIVTGEVLGQRPMSQRRETFPLIDREAGLEGYVLRPLSANLLKPTVPEIEGIVQRAKLCAMSGRSRKPQMALASEFGLKEYPAPAGGCLLTDPAFSYRLKELLSHDPDPALRDYELLKLGRHFRLEGGLKAVVGRDESENGRLQALALNSDYAMRVPDVGSPLAILGGDAGDSDLYTAASICARYSDAKRSESVNVAVQRGSEAFTLDVRPADEDLLDALRIQSKTRTGKTAKAG